MLSIGSHKKKKKKKKEADTTIPWAAALPIPVTALITAAIKLSLHSATFLQHEAGLYFAP